MSGLGFGGVPLSLVWELLAIDKASPAFKRVGASATATATATERAMARYTSTMRKTSALGASLTKKLTLPLAAIGALSVKAATDFNSAMTRIQTQAGASAKDVQFLSKQVLALSDHAQQGPIELANALYHLKSVGLDNAGAMKALKQASDLAAVGNANLEDTTNALAGAWRTGIKGAKNFHQAAATVNAIIGAGNMTLGDFNAALGTGVLASAKTFGLQMKDVGSALALFTDEGVDSAAAATRIRMSLSLLAAPSQAAEKVLSGIGLTGHQLGETMRKPNGLIQTIGLLKSHLEDIGNYYPNPTAADKFAAQMEERVKPLLDKKNLDRAQQSLVEQYGLAKEMHLVLVKGKLDASEQAAVLSHAFGGGRSSSAILSMVNNFDVLKKKQDQVTDSMKKFDHAVTVQQQTPQAKFKELEATLQHAAILLGNVLLPFVTSIVQKITAVGDWFTKQSDGTKKFAGEALIALVAVGPLLSIIGKLGLALKSVGSIVMFGPQFTAGILGAETAIGGVSSKAFTLGTKIRSVGGSLGRAFTSSSKAAGSFRAAIGGAAMGTALGTLSRHASGAVQTFSVLASTLSGAALGFATGGPLGAAVGGIAGLVSSLAATFVTMGDSAKTAGADAQRSLNVQKDTAQNLLAVLRQVNGAYTAQVKATVVQQLSKQGDLAIASKAGLNLPALIRSILANRQTSRTGGQSIVDQITGKLYGAQNQGKISARESARLIDDLQGVAKAAHNTERAVIQERTAESKGVLTHKQLGISLDKLRGDFKTTGREVDRMSAFGLHNREVIRENVGAINSAAAAELKHGASVKKVAAGYQDQIGKLHTNLTALGFNDKAVQDLIGSYGKLPRKVVTYLQKRGVNPADIQAIIDHYRTIPPSVSTTVYLDASQAYATLNSLRSQYASLGPPSGGATTTGSINFTPKHGASGFGNIPEGMFTVGERGWELGYRRGNQVSIFSNAASQAMTGMSRVPGYASGTGIRHVGDNFIYNGTRYASRRAAQNARHSALEQSRKDAAANAADRAAKQLDRQKTKSQDAHSALHSLESALSHFGKQIHKTGADVKSVFHDALAAVKQLGASKESLHRLASLDNKLAHKVDVRNRDMDRLHQLISSRRQLAMNIRGATIGGFDLPSSGTGFNGQKTPTFGRIFAQATQEKNIVHKWAAGLKKLAKVFGRSRVGKAMLRRLAEAGPASYPQVQALASASRGQLSRLVGVESSITETGTSIGGFVGGELYDRKVREARRQVERDRHQAERLFHMLDHRLKHLEHSFQVTVKVGDRAIARAVAEGNRKNQRRGAGR